MSAPKDFVAVVDSDARKTPRRIAFITKRTSPQVHSTDDAFVMTWPEGIPVSYTHLTLPTILRV